MTHNALGYLAADPPDEAHTRVCIVDVGGAAKHPYGHGPLVQAATSLILHGGLGNPYLRRATGEPITQAIIPGKETTVSYGGYDEQKRRRARDGWTSFDQDISPWTMDRRRARMRDKAEERAAAKPPTVAEVEAGRTERERWAEQCRRHSRAAERANVAAKEADGPCTLPVHAEGYRRQQGATVRSLRGRTVGVVYDGDTLDLRDIPQRHGRPISAADLGDGER